MRERTRAFMIKPETHGPEMAIRRCRSSGAIFRGSGQAFDFTLTRYSQILTTAREHGYRCCGLRDWYDQRDKSGLRLLLRHDVDRRPRNALAMAQCESRFRVSSTYYFRIFSCSLVPEIVEQIRDLGHEIGYHYEDWTTARGDPAKAIELFASNLERLRRIAPIRSIAMHGSPFAGESNLRLWQYGDFHSFDVIDATESNEFEGFAFITDSGRSFGPTSANLRDYLSKGVPVGGVFTSYDVCRLLAAGMTPKLYLSTHPERWNNGVWPWLCQWAWDISANAAKRLVRTVRERSSR